MYGLMKAHTCSRQEDDASPYRLHYCGTCKTMGSLYGQTSRMMLNHDAVFLAELLSALAPMPELAASWEGAYRSYNCFALPGTPEQMPISLQIAASATLLMTEFKLADQIDDSAHGGWRLAQKLFSPAFYEAAARLESHGFPLATIRDWYRKQSGREAAVRSGQTVGSPEVLIDSVAEPTATVTGLVFRHGASAVGATETVQQTMFALGFAFGKLIYTLDALDDFAKDARRGDFNALRYAFETGEGDAEKGGLSLEAQSETTLLLRGMQTQIEAALRTLPISLKAQAKFIQRLNSNLARRLGETKGSSCSVRPSVPSLPFREQWQTAWKQAGSLARTPEASRSNLASRAGKPFRFVAALGVALLFPQRVRYAASFGECRDIALNLMFLGEALNARFPRRLALAGTVGVSLPVIKPVIKPVMKMEGGAMPEGNPTHTESYPPAKASRQSGSGCCEGCGDVCSLGCGCMEICEGVNCCCGSLECCSAGCCCSS